MNRNSNRDNRTSTERNSLPKDDLNHQLMNKRIQHFSSQESEDSDEYLSVAKQINILIASNAPYLDSVLGICTSEISSNKPKRLLESMRNWETFLFHLKDLIDYSKKSDQRVKSLLESISSAKNELQSLDKELKLRSKRLEKVIENLNSALEDESALKSSPELRFRNEDIISKGDDFDYSEDSSFSSYIRSFNDSKATPDYKINLFKASEVQSPIENINRKGAQKIVDSFPSPKNSFYLSTERCYGNDNKKEMTKSFESREQNIKKLTRDLKRGMASKKPLQVINRKPLMAASESRIFSRFNSLLRNNPNSMMENLDSLLDIKESFIDLEKRLDQTNDKVLKLCKNLFNSYSSIRSRLDENLKLLNSIDYIKQRLHTIDYITAMGELTNITEAFRENQSKMNDSNVSFTDDTAHSLNEAIWKHDKKCYEDSFGKRQNLQIDEKINCNQSESANNEQKDFLERLDILNLKMAKCYDKIKLKAERKDSVRSFASSNTGKKRFLLTDSR